MPMALTHTRIIWALSLMVAQVPGVTPGPPCAQGVAATPHGEVRDNKMCKKCWIVFLDLINYWTFL